MASYLRSKDRVSIETQAYLYKWTHIPTQKWYVGSRTAMRSQLTTSDKNSWSFGLEGTKNV